MFSYPIGIDGTTLRVIQSGLAGRKIVFVHGTGARADRWSANLDAVAAAGWAAYAIDLPGHGFSDKSGALDHSVPGYAKVLGGFLDAIGADKVVLVATSLGGHVAATYAAAHPERIAGLVLCGSMGLVPIGEDARKRIGGGARNQTLDGIKLKFTRIVADPSKVSESLIEEEFRINNSPGAAESFARLGDYIATSLDDDVVGEKLGQLTPPLPTLLVWGNQDVVVPPAVGEAAHRLLPASRYVTVEAAGHTVYGEQPEIFNRELLAFLATLPA